jgi:uncharacterized protein (TIGR02001 family)
MARYILIAAALLAAAPARAQAQEDAQAGPQDGALEAPLDGGEEAPLGVSDAAFDFTGEIRLLSDYRFRGVSRSDEDPALQAALNLDHRSGFYLGARGTTLKGTDSFRQRDPGFGDLGDVEFDLYVGYSRELGGGWEVDAGAVYFLFAGGEGATDYVEPYTSLSYLIGPVYATAGVKYAPEQRATGGEDMLYLFGQLDVSVPFRPWSFSATVGHQDWSPFGSYWNWSLGVQHQLQIEALPDTEIGLSYVDTDLPSVAGQDATLVGSISLRF